MKCWLWCFLAPAVALVCGQQHLRIVTIDAPPFIYQSKESDPPEFSGFLMDLLTELRKHIQFSYEIYPVPDGKYGQAQANGQWNGMIGHLLSKQANMILAPLTVTSKREAVLDFSLPFMDAGITMIFKRPKPGHRLPFSSFLEMVTRDGMEYGAIKSGSTYQFFQGSHYKLYREMGDVMRSKYHELPASMSDAIEKVKKEENFVFIGETALVEYYLGYECDLMTVGDVVNSVGYALAFEKGSSLASIFSHHILRLKEEGLLDKLHAKWWSRKCRLPKLCVCNEKTSSEEEELIGEEETVPNEKNNPDFEYAEDVDKPDSTDSGSTVQIGTFSLILTAIIWYF